MGIEPSSSTEQKPILHTERKQKMKMQTNRIKRILSTILLLLLAVGMVTSCTKQPPKIEQPDNTTGEQTTESTPAQTTESTSAQTTENQNPSIEPPDEVLLEQIAEDYVRHLYGENYNSETCVEFVARFYYGTYNGYEIATITPVDKTKNLEIANMSSEGWEQEVDGIVFYHSPYTETIVWKNGTIYTIKEAYTRNFLTKEQVKILADAHKDEWSIMIG